MKSDSDKSISTMTDRVETIIEQLENGDVSLQEAKELHQEGEELLEALEAELDLEDGSITEISD